MVSTVSTTMTAPTPRYAQGTAASSSRRAARTDHRIEAPSDPTRRPMTRSQARTLQQSQQAPSRSTSDRSLFRSLPGTPAKKQTGRPPPLGNDGFQTPIKQMAPRPTTSDEGRDSSEESMKVIVRYTCLHSITLGETEARDQDSTGSRRPGPRLVLSCEPSAITARRG